MTTDPRISMLLATWESLRRAGQTVTVEHLCAHCPELVDELQRHVERASLADPTTNNPAGNFASARAAEAAAGVQSTVVAPAAPDPGTQPPPTVDSKTIAASSDTSSGHPVASESIGANPAVLSPLPANSVQAGAHLSLPGYEVLGELGRGGMGVVYKARQVGLNRLVAIKMILSGEHANPRERARFRSEAESVARLQHPNIVQIYDISQQDGCPWFSLEFVDGDSLYKWTSGKAIDPYDAAGILESLSLAIQYAHERGVIHRDLKPANILLSGGDGKSLSTFTPKITDFGLARQLEHDVRITQSGVVVGTPCYMAPEQVENPGGEVGPAVDIYGLGALLYELLTGRPPFCAATNFETMRQVVSEDPIPPSKINPAVPAALDRICLRCLEKEAVDRYHTARELADDLGLFLEGRRTAAETKRPSGVRRRPQMNSSRRAGRRPRFKPVYGQATKYLAVLAMALVFAGLVSMWRYRGNELRTLEEEVKELQPRAAAPAFLQPPIKVGILHSISGTMAISEQAVVDATVMAIDEINEQGGLLGREVQYVIRDGQSDPDVFFREANHLIKNEHVCVVFGVWTSSTRKTVLPVFETNNHLLIYPVSNEGLESSPNIFYVGAAPNQQIIPAVQWAYAYLNKRKFFLVGSDYIFPHAANEIIKDQLKILGGTLAGEAYIPLGSADVKGVIQRIKDSGADVIINTINGDSNIAFFRGLRAAGINSDKIPVISTSIGEQEMLALGISNLVGNYSAQNYFQSVDRPANTKFLERLHWQFNSSRVATDAMEAAYCGVNLWAKAVRQAATEDVVKVREALPDQTLDAPSGPIKIDRDLLNTHRITRIGRVGSDGQFEILNSSANPVAPIVYPETRTKAEWEAFEQDLFHKWGNRWINSDDARDD
jgi:urea transport system substrate-binding protein